MRLGGMVSGRGRVPGLLSGLSPLQTDLIVLYAPFVLVTLLTFANTPDDALITMRHAHHLITLGRPVYNPGENTEGFTSPLHLVVAAVIELIPGGATLLKLKVFSVLAAVAALWQARQLIDGVQLATWSRLVGLFMMGASWNFATSASNGLETSLVVLLVTGLTASLVRQDSMVRTAVWAALLAVARPESVLVIATLAAAGLFVTGKRPRWRSAMWILGPVATFSALLAVRWHFFGSLVPNTYFAKKQPFHQTFLGALDYIGSSQPLAHIFFPAAALLLVAQITFIVAAAKDLSRRRVLAYPLAVVSAQVVAVFQSGGDWMTGARFLVPALPSLVVLTCVGMEIAKPRLNRWRWGGVLLTAFIVGMAAPVGIHAAGRQHAGDTHNLIDTEYAPVWSMRGVSEAALIASGNYGSFGRMWPIAVEAIRCLKPGETVAFSEVGLIGYERLDLNVLDTRGLTDKRIATEAPVHEKTKYGVIDRNWYEMSSTVGKYLSERRPEMVMGIDAEPQSSAVGGLYVLDEVVDFRVGRPLSVYARNDFHCAP